MIEETARVTRTSAEYAWVETQRKSACGSCSANQGCGTAVIAKVVGIKRAQIKVLHSVPVKVGDEVLIGLQEDAIVQGSFAVYAVPLLAMLLMALLGDALSARLQLADSETLTILCAVAGLLGGFAWLRRYAARISLDARYQPVILRNNSRAHPVPSFSPLTRF